MTIAKTMAWTLNIPVSQVYRVLQVAGIIRADILMDLISPLFDARRGQIYTGFIKFRESKSGMIVKEDQIVMSADWANIE